MDTTETDRGAREKAAYDTGGFTAARRTFHGLYRHVYGSPNSLRVKAHWHGIVRDALQGRRVLEVGCGEGWDCMKFLNWGAAEVHGVDVSTAMLNVARQHETDRLKFFEHDLHLAWPHQYDVIVGRSVLHHLDYRTMLENLYEHNLMPGGHMVFVEPLGQGLMMRVYWKVGSRLHTPDERPFKGDDIEWLQRRFPNFEIISMNLASLPAACLSWVLRLPADNAMTRLADRVDVYLADRFTALRPHYRSAVFHIVKPA